MEENALEVESVFEFDTTINDDIDSRSVSQAGIRMWQLFDIIDVRSTSGYLPGTVIDVIERYYTNTQPTGLHDKLYQFLRQHLSEINSGHYMFRWDRELCGWFRMTAYRMEYIFAKSTVRMHDVWTTKLWVFISKGPAKQSEGKSPVILKIKPMYFRGGATTKDMTLLVNGATTPKDWLDDMASLFPWYNGLKRLSVRPGFWTGSEESAPQLRPHFSDTNLNFSWALLFALVHTLEPLSNMRVVHVMAEWH